LAAEVSVRRVVAAELVQFRLIPDAPGLRYDLLVEFDGATPDDEVLGLFLEAFDDALGRENDEYRSKRKSKRLLPPRLCVMERGWAEAQRRADIAGGKRDGQYKWPVFRAGWDAASQSSVACVIDRAKRRSSSQRVKVATSP
jgi:hypothetical protein